MSKFSILAWSTLLLAAAAWTPLRAQTDETGSNLARALTCRFADTAEPDMRAATETVVAFAGDIADGRTREAYARLSSNGRASQSFAAFEASSREARVPAARRRLSLGMFVILEGNPGARQAAACTVPANLVDTYGDTELIFIVKPVDRQMFIALRAETDSGSWPSSLEANFDFENGTWRIGGLIIGWPAAEPEERHQSLFGAARPYRKAQPPLLQARPRLDDWLPNFPSG